MNPVATIAIAASSALALAWMIWLQVRSPNWLAFILGLLGLAAYLGLMHSLFGFPALGIDAKAADDGSFPKLALAMYICMLLGMAAESLYQYLDVPDPAKRRFDIGTFIKPFLVSPLVFMPLATSLQNASVDFTRFDAARLMVFLVAFENGFLWRGYFSRKLKEGSSAEGRKRP